VDLRSNGQRGEGEVASPAARFSMRGGAEGGRRRCSRAPRAGRGVDDAQNVEVNSTAWSTRTGTSWSEAEERLERPRRKWPLVVVQSGDFLRVRRGGKVRGVRSVEVERMEERRGRMAHWRRRIWPGELAGMAEIRRRIASARGGLCEREERRGERESRGLYRRGIPWRGG
jgi:hypothetical protein